MLSNFFFQTKWFLSKVLPSSEKGQGLVEYALIIVLVSIVVIVALGLLGGQVNSVFQTITTTLGGAGTTP
jgi:pilus assembly protein Flp/PilA